jgi:hypothetical protein
MNITKKAHARISELKAKHQFSAIQLLADGLDADVKDLTYEDQPLLAVFGMKEDGTSIEAKKSGCTVKPMCVKSNVSNY